MTPRLFVNGRIVLVDRLMDGGAVETRGERIVAVYTAAAPVPPRLDEQFLSRASAASDGLKAGQFHNLSPLEGGKAAEGCRGVMPR